MDLFDIVISGKINRDGGGGGDVSVDALNVVENGVYSASSGHAFSPVTVSVPQSGITPTGTKNIDSNGIYDVTSFASASVAVPQPSGTSSITANGIYDITSFASVDVNVSGGGGGGYTADDIAMRTISGVVSGSAALIQTGAFCLCSGITAAYFPNAESVYTDAFASCSSLSIVSLPNAKIFSNSVFLSCNELTELSLPNATKFAAYTFASCKKLSALYLLGSSVVSIPNANLFTATPMSDSSYTGSFGSIYVPASLVSSYKTASKWSLYADRITSYVE